MSDWMMGTLADNDADESRSAMYDADYDFDYPTAAELAADEADDEDARREAAGEPGDWVIAPDDAASPWLSTSFTGPIEPPPF